MKAASDYNMAVAETERSFIIELISDQLNDLHKRNDLVAISNFVQTLWIRQYDEEHPEGLEKRLHTRKLYQERRAAFLERKRKSG